MNISRLRTRSIQILAVSLLAAAGSFNTLFNGFVSDDVFQVLGNPWIADWSRITDIFLKGVWAFESATSNYYRPMMHLIYMVAYHIFGFNAWGFHLVNLLFHAGTSVLVFLLASRLLVPTPPPLPRGDEERFRTSRNDKPESKGPLLSFPLVGNPSDAGNGNANCNPLPGGPTPTPLPGGDYKGRPACTDIQVPSRDGEGWVSPPFIAALLFAVYPIHTEAEAWIAGVPELSFAFFSLLSFYFYIRSREGLKGGYALSLMVFSLAMLCKEPAVTLPVILIAYDYAYGKGRPGLPFILKRYAPYLIAAAGYLALRFHALGGFSPLRGQSYNLSAYQYFISVFPLFTEYLWTMLFPVKLSFWHVFHPLSSLFTLKGMISLSVTAVFFGLLVISMKKNRTVFLSLLLFLVPLLPAFYIPAIPGRPFAERYLYLPSFGFVMLAAWVYAWMIARKPGSSAVFISIFLLVAGLYLCGTVLRNFVWKDDLTLWTDAAGKSPGGAQPHYILGDVYRARGMTEKAIEEYRLSLGIDPGDFQVHNNLGIVYKSIGRTTEAALEYQEALRLKPGDVTAHYNLGNLYREEGDFGRAIEQYRAAISLGRVDDIALIHNNLGIAYAGQGNREEAEKEFRIAIQFDPDCITARNNLESLLSRGGAR